MRLIRAIAASTWFWLRVERWHAVPRLLSSGYLIWLTISGRGRRASVARAEARLASCRECPIFCKELQTCGDFRGLTLPEPDQMPTPEQQGRVWMNLERGWWEPASCGCYMPLKVKLAESSCWARENFGEDAVMGWPMNLCGEEQKQES